MIDFWINTGNASTIIVMHRYLYTLNGPLTR